MLHAIITALQAGRLISAISRAAGLTAYLLLSLAVLAGLWSTSGLKTRLLSKKGLVTVHESLATFGLLLAMGHGFILRFGSRPMRWVDIVAPYISPRHQLVLVLGMLCLYLITLVIVTTDLRTRLGYRQWRFLHQLSLPAWVLGLVHGLFMGPDTTRPWVMLIYILPAVLTFTVGAIWVASLRRQRGCKQAPVEALNAANRSGELHARPVSRG